MKDLLLDGIINYSQDPIVNLIGDWIGEINIYSIIVRVILSVLIGGIIGAERASKHHVAGLRTHILVCLGSCVAMFINCFITENADVARLGAGVITGIGFLGAGTILVTSRNQVRGLTTAAALWTAGTLGLAIGVGFYTLALCATVLIIISLIFLPKIERALQKKSHSYDIHIELHARTDLKKLLAFLREKNIIISSISYDPAYANSGLSVYTLVLISKKNKDGKYLYYNDLVVQLRELEYVNYVDFMD